MRAEVETTFKVLGIVAVLVVLFALGPMIFPIVIVGVLALLGYGLGKASR
jgi:hypothetical protein